MQGYYARVAGTKGHSDKNLVTCTMYNINYLYTRRKTFTHEKRDLQ